MAAPPAQMLDRLLQQRVTLRLKDGREMTGRLMGADEHLNLVLDDVQEKTPEIDRRLGRVVLRGSNIVSLNAPSAPPAGTTK
ncbi:MAG TPA: LSM domain-containing protein [Thermoplasmata archaeon]